MQEVPKLQSSEESSPMAHIEKSHTIGTCSIPLHTLWLQSPETLTIRAACDWLQTSHKYEESFEEPCTGRYLF